MKLVRLPTSTPTERDEVPVALSDPAVISQSTVYGAQRQPYGCGNRDLRFSLRRGKEDLCPLYASLLLGAGGDDHLGLFGLL